MKNLLSLLVLVASLHPALAVEKLVSGTATFNTTDPGWITPGGLSAWAYVGQVSGASGTYLRNGWVLTAAHVGPGDFTLGGTTYLYDGTTQTFGTADIRVFHLTVAPILPDLDISAVPPVPLGPTDPGDQVGIIGFGGGAGETWGLNTVTRIAQPTAVTVGSTTYTTTDFVTDYGTTSAGLNSTNNQYVVVGGDSGGGDFIQQSGSYKLVGINEAVDLDTNSSYFVQLSTYKTQVDAATAVPEPATDWLIAVGSLFVVGNQFARRKRNEKLI